MTTTTAKKQKFKLIDGTFTPSEAKTILMNMVSAKIKHHSVEHLSARERHNKDPEITRQRIVELREMQNQLSNELELAAEEGVNLKIRSFIEITYTK